MSFPGELVGIPGGLVGAGIGAYTGENTHTEQMITTQRRITHWNRQMVRSARWDRVGEAVQCDVVGKDGCDVQTRRAGTQDRAQPLMVSMYLI